MIHHGHVWRAGLGVMLVAAVSAGDVSSASLQIRLRVAGACTLWHARASDWKDARSLQASCLQPTAYLVYVDNTAASEEIRAIVEF